MKARSVSPLAVALALVVTGCARPGTPASSLPAKKIGQGTGHIATACGESYELRAFGGPHPPGLTRAESLALSGVHELAAVYAHDHTDLYQGESIGAVVHDSISLLQRCRLPAARTALSRALSRRS